MNKITAYMCVPDLDMFLCPTSSCVGASADELLNWLIFSSTATTASKFKVAWNISEFAKAVLSRLPKKVSDNLSKHPHRTVFGNYRLYFFPEKKFGISKNNSDADFYDLAQYYIGENEPGTITELQERASELQQEIEELAPSMGLGEVKSLASPLAIFRDCELIRSIDAPSIFDLTATSISEHRAMTLIQNKKVEILERRLQ